MIKRLLSQTKGPLAMFLTFAFVLSLWAAATPMFGTPDEPAHMVRAAGLVRGQLNGIEQEQGYPLFEVPSIFVAASPCYAFKPNKTASCLNVEDDGGTQLVPSSAASYPPGFHLIIGLPTLVSKGQTSLYLMRITHVALCSIFFTMALRITAQLKAKGAAVLGFAVALTPMVLFLSGAVNPSGIAAATGLTIWTAGLKLGEPSAGRPPPHLSAAFGFACCILLMTRRDSVLWLAAIGIIFAISIGWARLDELARDRHLQVWGVVVAAVAITNFFLFSRDLTTSFVTAADEQGSAAKSFGFIWFYVRELIGTFGWLDTSLHIGIYYGWFSAFMIVLLAALVLASWRDVLAVTASVALFIAIITVVGSMRFPYFQGRYTLAFSVGIPVLAAHAAGKRSSRWVSTVPFPPRLVAVSLVSLFLLHQMAFAQHLRRYAVGANGPIDILSEPSWQPTVAPIWVLLVLYLIASILLMLMLARVALSREPGGANLATPEF